MVKTMIRKLFRLLYLMFSGANILISEGYQKLNKLICVTVIFLKAD